MSEPAILVTEAAAAKLLGFAPATLRRWRCSGHGPRFVKVDRGRIRYRRSDLEEWAAGNLVEPRSDRGAA